MGNARKKSIFVMGGVPLVSRSIQSHLSVAYARKTNMLYGPLGHLDSGKFYSLLTFLQKHHLGENEPLKQTPPLKPESVHSGAFLLLLFLYYKSSRRDIKVQAMISRRNIITLIGEYLEFPCGISLHGGEYLGFP